jgi:hypothetical protein
MDRHDEIKTLLSASRKLLTNQQISESISEIRKSHGIITEQDDFDEYETASSGDAVVDKINVAQSVEDETEKAQKKNEDEKTQKYRISGGLLKMHGFSKSELELTTDEKAAFQETMDEFVNEVSDLVDFNEMKVYKNNVEWSGTILDLDINFLFLLNENNGVYIEGNMMKVDDNFMTLVGKLKNYYQKFKSKWAKVLAARKKTKTEE